MKLPTDIFWEETASFIYRAIIQPALLLGLLLGVLYVAEAGSEIIAEILAK